MNISRILKSLAVFAILTAWSLAQTPVPGVDFPSPIPIPFIGFTTGTTNPPLCVPGRSPFHFRTDSTTYYYCSARNTWTAFRTTGGAQIFTTVTSTGLLPVTVGATTLGAVATPFWKLFLGTAATNNFVVTPASTSAARVITMADPGGAATLAYTNPTTAQTITNTSLTSASVITDIRATTAGSETLGTAAKPFGSLIIGTAATNNLVITPVATGAARAIAMADPGGAATLAYINSTSAQKLTTTTSFVDSTDATKQLAISLSGATGTTSTTLTLAQTANRVVTFPDASITLSGASGVNCGTGSACGSTALGANLKVVVGTVTLTTGTASITGISPAFTSVTSYACSAGAAHAVAFTNSGTTSVALAGTSSDPVSYICIGN